MVCLCFNRVCVYTLVRGLLATAAAVVLAPYVRSCLSAPYRPSMYHLFGACSLCVVCVGSSVLCCHCLLGAPKALRQEPCGTWAAAGAGAGAGVV
jgi:hypothetical protein